MGGTVPSLILKSLEMNSDTITLDFETTFARSDVENVYNESWYYWDFAIDPVDVEFLHEY